MKNILQQIALYQAQQKAIAKNNDPESIKLQKHIEIAKDLLHKLRLNIRKTKLKNIEEEIHFFKHIKPKIYADYILYSHKLNYHLIKPNSLKSVQKQYIKNDLKKIEAKKRNNIQFYKYYKQGNSVLDHVYFSRNNQQLQLFSENLIISLDPEFYTSHDALAAEVIAYDLLTNFYKKEINKIKNIERGIFSDDIKFIKTDLSWTASKTDLIELVYALKVTGAINTGNINTKDLITALSKVFNIEISNYYKIYSEIKNRSKVRAKFLNKLIENFQAKLEYDDGL